MTEYRYPGYGPTRESWLTSRPNTKGGYHGGNDNPAPAGTPVYAQYDGTVFRSGNINGYGLAVVVETKAPNGTVFYTLYGHLAPQDLPAPDTPIAAGQPIPGAFIGTKEDVQRLGGLSSGPHLHREIISSKVRLNRDSKQPFGLNSSDITYKADPDTFDINNPVFPYQNNEPKPPPQPAPTTPSARTAPQPAVLILPHQSEQPNPPQQPRPIAPPARSPLLSPSRPGIGPPLDITPRLAPGAPSPGAVGPAPATDGLPPLHFAPETPPRVGPFEVPGLFRSDVFGSPRVAPAADGTGANPSILPTPSPGAPSISAPAMSPATSGMTSQIGIGIGDWWKGVSPAASSNFNPSSLRGLTSLMPGMMPLDPNQSSRAADAPLGIAGGAPGVSAPTASPAASGIARPPSTGNPDWDWWNGLVADVDAVNRRNGFGGLNIPMPNNVPTPLPQTVFDRGLPGMLQRVGAFDPPVGGLLGRLLELQRNHPDDDASA